MGQTPDDLTTGSRPSPIEGPTDAPVFRVTGGKDASGGQGDLPEMRAELEHIRTDLTKTIDAIEAKLTPEHLAQEAAGHVRSQVQGQKGHVADGLSTVAQALRLTGEQLREQNQGGVAQYLERTANRVDSLSRSVRDQDVGRLIGEVEQFARRQPALFVGSAFAIGLIGGRFVKSSSEASRGSGINVPPPGSTPL